MKIILQDIDNVSYPFKEKHTEYLLDQNLIDAEDAKRFLESKKPYLIDYLLSEAKLGKCPYKMIEKIREKYKDKFIEIKEMLKIQKINQTSDENLDLEVYFFSTLDDFFASKYYKEGAVTEIQALNKQIKDKNPETQIIGITARAIHLKTNPEEYEALTQQTMIWSNTNNIRLDKIFFEHKKINAYHKIKNMEEYKNKEIICFLEDDPNNIEEFLREKITCVLINFEYYEGEELLRTLKEKYPNELKIANTPQHANEIIQELIMNV